MNDLNEVNAILKRIINGVAIAVKNSLQSRKEC